MFESTMQQRIAVARIQAGLMKTGFCKMGDVLVRLPEETPLSELETMLTPLLRSESDHGLRNARPLEFESIFGEDGKGRTHACIDAKHMDVPGIVLHNLARFRSNLSVGPGQLGWVLAVSSEKQGAEILLRLSPERAGRQRVHLERYAAEFTEALGVPTRLELGMLPEAQIDRWAHERQPSANAGCSVGGTTEPIRGGTITAPVRLKAAKSKKSEPFAFLTAAHIFEERSSGAVRATQPKDNFNPDGLIGSRLIVQYEHSFFGKNFFDACIFSSSRPASYQFGKNNKYTLSGVWDGPLTSSNRLFIYGSTSGMKSVQLEFSEVISVAILSSDGMIIDYRDMIEFSNGRDDEKPASLLGDSGAPLLVHYEGKYYLAGMVVGGGSREGQKRKPRSYAVPIGRIFERLGVELW